MNLAKIAKETLKIVDQGYYEIDHKVHSLKLSRDEIDEVIVVKPELVRELSEEAREYEGEGIIEVVGKDSFEAARSLKDDTIVLNFANALNPGGGFLKGANAQEEALCRHSTLFFSIGNKKASEMYHYNFENLNGFDSEYMLVSPRVEVFRDAQGQLVEDSFVTSVISYAAPNLNGRAGHIPQRYLMPIMKIKIRDLLNVCIHFNYRNVVLGAWGCGAFGHDGQEVAKLFYSILVEEEYRDHFDQVVFAIPTFASSRKNYEAFEEVFHQTQS
ncbi:MAG TPA: TIGR02452 family protein [Erysipelotrichaceae bacterium]|nr:TIGR02452 family protein [Erysipelotrichaceae bacterium]HCJ37093.1 TIGR02452 family protein [Erysipelotrichaceae bacterium]